MAKSRADKKLPGDGERGRKMTLGRRQQLREQRGRHDVDSDSKEAKRKRLDATRKRLERAMSGADFKKADAERQRVARAGKVRTDETRRLERLRKQKARARNGEKEKQHRREQRTAESRRIEADKKQRERERKAVIRHDIARQRFQENTMDSLRSSWRANKRRAKMLRVLFPRQAAAIAGARRQAGRTILESSSVVDNPRAQREMREELLERVDEPAEHNSVENADLHNLMNMMEESDNISLPHRGAADCMGAEDVAEERREPPVGTHSHSRSPTPPPADIRELAYVDNENLPVGMKRPVGIEPSDIGTMTDICASCHARLFPNEHTPQHVKLGMNNLVIGMMCCRAGKIELEPLFVPELFLDFVSNNQEKTRQVNNQLAFTSMFLRKDLPINKAIWDKTHYTQVFRGPPSFIAQGQINHLMGSLDAARPDERVFSQLYMHDPAEAAKQRAAAEGVDLPPALLFDLAKYIEHNHPFGKTYATLREMPEDLFNEVAVVARSHDRQTGAKPREMASIIWNDHMLAETNFMFRVEAKPPPRKENHTNKDNRYAWIPHIHALYDPLRYPLLFPMGETGWHPYIPFSVPARNTNLLEALEAQLLAAGVRRSDRNRVPVMAVGGDVDADADGEGTSRKFIAMREFYAYRLMDRLNEPSLILRSGRLLQEFAVDMAAKIHSDRIHYHQKNQRQYATASQIDEHFSRNEAGAGATYDDVAAAIDRAAHDEAVREGLDPDAVAGASVGKRTYLPATVTMSARDMQKKYHEAMTIVSCYGPPTIFLTATCNPEWPEIQTELAGTGQAAHNRPDLVARVFNLKWNQMLVQIIDAEIFGPIIAHVFVIEFQKRGLPHAHSVFWFRDGLNRNLIDALIWAEIPDKNVYPELYAAVAQHMMHTCSERCREGNGGTKLCSRHFPQPYCNATVFDENSFALYLRRRDGRTITKNGRELDNRYVVPFNPYLLLTFLCHINVVLCATVDAIAYLFKYLFKGSDRIYGTLKSRDECQRALDGRYLGAAEAFWMIFGFKMHRHFPAIMRLALYLEGDEGVTFNRSATNDEIQVALERRGVTTLEAFFKFNVAQRKRHLAELKKYLEAKLAELEEHFSPLRLAAAEDSELLAEIEERHDEAMLAAKAEIDEPNHPLRVKHDKEKMLYADMPKYYTFKDGAWKALGKGRKGALGQIYYVNPRQGERYYLRLMTSIVRQPISHMEFRTVYGRQYDTYHEACRASGQLGEHEEAMLTMQEARTRLTSPQGRDVFAVLLTHNKNMDAKLLWETFKRFLSADFAMAEARRRHEQQVPLRDHHFQDALAHIQEILATIDDSLKLSDFGLPFDDDIYGRPSASFMDAHTPPDIAATRAFHAEWRPRLNAGQAEIYERVMAALREGQPLLMFVDGPGGYGKSLLFNVILAGARAEGLLCVATATMGLPALILELGRTVHSQLKVPLSVEEGMTLPIPMRSKLALFWMAVKFFIIDEASALRREILEAINLFFNDLWMAQHPGQPLPAGMRFGGKCVLIGGDFRQTMPVVTLAAPQQTFACCIKQSPLWQHFEIMRLTENVRVQGNDEEARLFKEWLLKLGEGRLFGESVGPYTTRLSSLPQFVGHRATSLDELLDSVLGNISEPPREGRPAPCYERASILTPLNKSARHLNNIIMGRFYGESREYTSKDNVVSNFMGNEEGRRNLEERFPETYLNSLEPSGLPPHRLILKVNSPALIMRNIRPKKGLCNGSRVIITDLGEHLIGVRLASAPPNSETIFLPKIELDSSPSNNLPVHLRRLQFPLMSAFVLTINKAQGQSLERVGLWLPKQVFSHGQLYVAMSRVTSPRAVTYFDEPKQYEKNPEHLGSLHNVVFDFAVADGRAPPPISVERDDDPLAIVLDEDLEEYDAALLE